MQTLEKFLAGSDLGIRCRKVNPNGDRRLLIAEPWATTQYRCELHGSNGDRPIRTIVGSDNGPPDMEEVLDAIAAQAAVVEEVRSFEEWAVRMGFDPDSRFGERIYRAWRRQADALRALIGEESYQRLLWETERL